ncbi:hypothetical protein A3SI_10844 [Nitritalea halalkaliphila LW7]|uniref:Uncharacterized protein n=1 Tax=Nitritalea halalkaliphila LW7 TaxID=1189621 RepID=I5C3A1_9BACT|nr:hypothetical protein [Nitritalea halalkaliphila]EIM76303.1 hypothetical protein A3SI_10844 [Nitritalea halalkaliphila LW7]
MDYNKMNELLRSIVEKRIQLSKLSYADEAYDDIEEEMQDLEDDFNEEYEPVFQKAFEEIYKTLGSDNDILLPSAYLANKYTAMLPDAQGLVNYEVKGKEGVPIESEQFDGQDVRLVLIPNPTRIAMQINGMTLKVLWTGRA